MYELVLDRSTLAFWLAPFSVVTFVFFLALAGLWLTIFKSPSDAQAASAAALPKDHQCNHVSGSPLTSAEAGAACGETCDYATLLLTRARIRTAPEALSGRLMTPEPALLVSPSTSLHI